MITIVSGVVYAAYLPPNDGQDISYILGKNLNDEVVFENTAKFSTVTAHVHAPTGGKVCFEGSVNGTEWESITFRDITNDVYASSTNDGTPFIGSVIGLQKIRFRTCVAGSADGSVAGRASRNVAILEGIEFGHPPHRFGFTPVHKDASYTTAQTGTSIWTPASGNKFVVTDVIIVASGVTDADVTLFDETDASGNRLIKGSMEVSNNKNTIISFSPITPFISSADDNDLKITTSANIDIDITLHGYEID
jgi:hypothetical protein